MPETLNKQFMPVLTNKINMHVHDNGQSQSQLPDIPDLNICTAGIAKQRFPMIPTKACETDELQT